MRKCAFRRTASDCPGKTKTKTWPGHGICNELENYEKKNREEEVSHASLFGRDTLKTEPEPKVRRVRLEL